MTHSVFPSTWKLASVSPVYKGSSVNSDLSNYRPVSLLPMSKVFETLINQRLLAYLEDRELLTDVQCMVFGIHGQQVISCQSLITEHINQALDRRGVARLVARDISKAFNKFWHEGLIHKLKSYGISGKLLSLITSFLRRQISVVHEGYSSSTCQINAGVP